MRPHPTTPTFKRRSLIIGKLQSFIIPHNLKTSKPASRKLCLSYIDFKSPNTAPSSGTKLRNVQYPFSRNSLCPTAIITAESFSIFYVNQFHPYSPSIQQDRPKDLLPQLTFQLSNSRIRSTTLLFRISGQLSLNVRPKAPRPSI